MLREARAAGLLIDNDRAAAILGGDPAHAQPHWNSIIHNSLTPWWWLGEFWPKWTKRRVSPPGQSPEEFSGWPRLNLFRRRTIEANATIHQSVIDRRDHDRRYRPEKPVVEPDHETRSYPVFLQAGDRVVVGIHASLHWNDTCIQMSAGEEYLLEATGHWYDAAISTGPDGYESPNLLFKSLQWLRRANKANWFALIGVVGNDARTTFSIGNAVRLVVPADGILRCYANDLPFLYRNNSGHLALTVTRVR